MNYVYGQDGQRAAKYTAQSETLYYNKMWTLHTDGGNSHLGGEYAKNVYLGETRIVTKLVSANEIRVWEEVNKIYFYHSDHLGSASLITDENGNEYQRLEYTPYGEVWVDKYSQIQESTALLPYKFTGKERDEETGLYYYGARYLDPQTSVWLSTDPALGEYIPQAGKDNSQLPGLGGVFNTTNCHLYHYAGNNPVRYTDPTGAFDWNTNTIESGDTLSQIAQDCNTRYGTNYSAADLQGLNSDTISDKDKIYARNHMNLGKAEEVKKRAADYTSRATTHYSTQNMIFKNKSTVDNGSFKTWINKQQGDPLTPKEIQIQRNWGIGEMISGPVIGIGACEASYGASVEAGLYIMADGAVMISKAEEGVKQGHFMFFAALKSPATAEINGVPVNVEVPNPANVIPRLR